MVVSFGLERLGLLSQKYPRSMLGAVLLACIFFLYGAAHLGIDSNIRDLFKSDNAAYGKFEEATKQYPSRENDILLLVEGDNLLDPDILHRLGELSLDVMLLDGVQKVISIFDAQHVPSQSNPSSGFIIPDAFDPTYDRNEVAAALKKHPFVAKTLLSDDDKATLFIINLDEGLTDLAQVRLLCDEIKQLAKTGTAGQSVRVSLTGIPVVRTLLLDVLNSDKLTFRLASYLLSILLAWLFFGQFRYMILAIAPPLVVTIWLLGGMGWTGRNINAITNVVPTLVMIITFSNAIHFLIALRRHQLAGLSRDDAIATTIRTVGPASVLTSITTAIALISLTLAGQPTITTFALTAAYGTALAFIAVLAIIPALATLLLKEGHVPSGGHLFAKLVAYLSEAASSLVMKWGRGIALSGALMVAAGGYLYSLNEPHFFYTDHLPRDSDAYHAIKTIDQKLSGTSNIQVFLQWQSARSEVSADMIDLIGEVHRILKAEQDIRQVWSLYSLYDWRRKAGKTDAEIRAFFHENVDSLGTFILLPQRSALVSGQLPEMDAQQLNPLLESLETKLSQLAMQYPDADITVTGIAAQTARSTRDIIGNLSASLAVAIVLIIVLIGCLLRSPITALYAILPNLLPLTSVGAFLYLSGHGLQFNSIIALTVGFGIAVDSTIHMLNYYHGTRAALPIWQERLNETIRHIGPALIVSTLALLTGGVTILSPMPTTQLYGILSVMVLVMALIGDLLVLPAIIRTWESTRPKAS
ncbi:efflux RND transporter permease subunit [Cohaesibacter intestini]|uniref:efflux RND transporter permease subunit n=1 Tax=Cohaesibacter intestini TaxID=2211145 RepID=UPI000DEA26CC|nr:MMPL family transporter [Cohaesibacter intestini]